MAFVDFAELKSSVRIADIVTMLGLTMRAQGDQLRAACPVCKTGGDRALSVNTSKNVFQCFASGGQAKGDCISLAAHILEKSQKEAAEHIANHFKFAGGNSSQVRPSDTAPPAPQAKHGFDPTAYLAALQPEHEILQPLGISAETLKAYRSGYSKGGVNRGRLALALCDVQGNILGFAGRSLTEPQIIYPNGLDPASIIFGADHVAGEVRLVRDVIDVLSAFETGESAVCFLTESIEPQQLEMLAALLDQKKCKLFF